MSLKIGNQSSQIISNIEHYGFVKTFEDLAVRLLNRIVFFKILKCININRVDPEFLKCDEKFRGLFLPDVTLRELAKNPDRELPETFLNQSLAKGDECYGFFDGDILASYG